MPTNKIQIKRTAISGRTPNTTNAANTSYIDAGELAVNLTDQKLYSSNGTASFEVGSNLASLSVGSIVANGATGTAGQALVSNGSAVFWSNNPGFTGSAGPQGAAGPTGSQGPVGFTGSTGAQGPAGATGPQGTQGNIGFTGSTGAQGAQGATGPQGTQGAVGFTGSTGPQGATGLTGPQGTTGFTGSVGAQGPAGATGPQGNIGFTGSTGAQGATGPQGTQGATGPQGPIGFTGSTGAQGAQGATGPQGTQGATGFTGSVGAQGPAGSTGPQGPIGFTGSVGAQGAQGAQGATGPQGTQGATGPQGPIGFTGSVGAQGPQGATGPQGLAGPTGPQGTQGAAGPTGSQGPIGFTGSTGLTSGDQTITGIKTFSNTIILPAPVGDNSFIAGTGDGASLSIYNFALSGWNGMAFYNPTVGGAFPNAVSGVVNFRDGSITMRGDFRAPIFYDSNNTAYYTDPASTSLLGAVQLNNVSIDPSNIGAGVGIGTINESSTGFSAPGIAFGTGTGQHGAIVYGGGIMYFGTENGSDNTLNTKASLNSDGVFTVSGDMRAPIFYDSGDTGYYFDGNSLSKVNQLTRRNTRVNAAREYPVGHYTPGETLFEIDPTWSETELRNYFGSNNVSWVADSTAPGGYAISITGNVNVGGVYDSGFPYIPVDQDDVFYMEVWVKDVSGTNLHYMGSIDYGENFNLLGGNPGSFGYWVMANSGGGATWTKYSGYITGFGTATGQFVSGTKYFTPQALFNFNTNGTSYISGWKVIKVSQAGNRSIIGRAGSIQDNSVYALDVFHPTSYRQLRVRSSGDPLIKLSGSYNSGNGGEIWQNSSGTLSFNINSGMNGFTTTSAGSTTFSGDARAPIFYDSNNTAFYIDPSAGGSLVLGEFQIQNSGFNGLRIIAPGGTQSLWVRAGYDTDGSPTPVVSGTNVMFQSSGSSGGSFTFVSGNTRALTITGDYAQGGGSLRAPIFYDSNDTAYFIDPNSTSVLNTVRAAQIQHSSGNVAIALNDATWTRLHDPNGVTKLWLGGADPNNYYNANIHYFRNLSSATTMTIDANGVVIATADMRAPIFYDSNDTTYYVDPNATGTSLNARGNIILGPNIINGRFLRLGGDLAGNIDEATIAASNGNLHIDSKAGFDLYLNWYNARPVWSEGGAYFPIYFDRNNTAYYVDPAGTTVLNGLSVGGLAVLRTHGTINNNIDSDYGEGFVTFDPVPSGTPPIASPNLRTINVGNNYSRRTQVAFDFDTNRTWFRRRTDVWSVWSEYWHSNSPTISATADMRAPIFYDSNNTAYYLDPAGTESGFLRGTLRFGDFGAGIVGQYDSFRYQLVFAMGDAYKGALDGTNVTSGYGLWWSHPNAGGVAANLNNHGLMNIVNGTWQASFAGSTRALNDMRTPIYYDLNDTGYYVDPNGTSRLGTVQMGNTLNLNGWQESVATTSFRGIEFHSVGDRSYYIGKDAGAWTQPLTIAFYTGIRYFASQDYNGSRFFNSNNGSMLFSIGDGDGSVRVTNDIRSPIYYDSNNTGFYVDPNSGSKLFDLNVEGTGNKYLLIYSTTGNEAMVRYIGGTGNSWYVGKRTSSQLVGTESFHFFSEAAGATVAGIDPSGNIFSSGSVRAPIFYDSNDTAYQIDGNGTSVLAGLRVNYPAAGYVLQDYGWLVAQDSSARGISIGYDPAADRTWMYSRHVGVAGKPISLNDILIVGTWGGFTSSAGSMRAPIFYDSDNTGFYVDPNSITQLSSVYANDWFRAQGVTGFWFQDYGRGMRSPDGEGNPYGNVATHGTGRNGWLGWGIGSRHVFMSTGGDNVGVHDNSRGWIWYWDGSYTQFPYGFTFFGGSARSPIFYDSDNTAYYADFASTGDSIRAAGNIVAYFSDDRLKTKFGNITNAIDKVCKLNGFYYEANETAQKLGYKPKREVGVSAQELQEVLPEVVTGAPVGHGYLTVDYERIVPLLIEAIKELTAKVEALEAR
jgi:hypothetical protein